MKRGGYLQRRTPLRSRSRLSARGVRGKRLAPADAIWRAAVMQNAGHWCEWPGCQRPAEHAHHVEGRQARPDLRHDVANGRALCRRCHGYAHANPQEARAVLA